MSRKGYRCRRALVLAVSALAFLAGCGGDDSDSSGTSGAADGNGTSDGDFAAADVKVVAEDIDFPQTRFTAAAGEVSIAYRNDGRIPHTLVLEDVEEWEKLMVDERGDVASGRITLEPGEYVVFCDIAGHRAQGMEGTLTVE